MEQTPPISAWSRFFGVLKLLFGAVALGLPLHYLGVPAGMLLGSIVGSALVNQRWFGMKKQHVMPNPLRDTGLFIVGLVSGVLLTPLSLISTVTVALPIAGAYLALGALNLIFIALLMIRYKLDPVTAVLSLAPGGLAEILTMAADKKAEIGIVITVHSVRLFTIVLVLLPLLLLVLAS